MNSTFLLIAMLLDYQPYQTLPNNEYVKLKLVNPCARNIQFGFSRNMETTSGTSYNVLARKNLVANAAKGYVVKYLPADSTHWKKLGVVTSTGQTFTCPCASAK